MRGRLRWGALLAVGVLMLLALWRLTGGTPEQDPEGAEASGPRTPRAPVAARPREARDPDASPSTPDTPTAADGVLEVEVREGERPVPGAPARLYRRGPRDPNLGTFIWWRVGEGLTDAAGRVVLAAGPGDYLVSVRVEGHAPLVRDVVRPQAEARTRVVLQVEPGVRLEGRTVVGTTREPLPLVRLVLARRSAELAFWLQPELPEDERVQVTSNERGLFRVDGLAPGVWRLEADTPGYALTVIEQVKVPAGKPLEVALQAAGIIEGFVVDARGEPAAGAEVQLGGKTAQQLVTGEGGGFSGEVEAGAYTVMARRGEEAGALETPVVVSAGMTVRGVRLQLGPGAVLEGRVWAKASGAPVAQARVDVSPLGGNGDLGRASTDADGRFQVRGLASGAYDVVVGAQGFATVLRRGVMLRGREHFTLDVTLGGLGSVEGHVRDPEGRPVEGARVLAFPRQDPLDTPAVETRTDAEGHYRLEGVTPGPQRLVARRDGATQGMVRPVEVGDSGPARVDFTLETTGVVEGVVRGRLPDEPLEVTATPTERHGPGWSERRGTPVDAAGAFRLVLAPGSYQVALASTRAASPAERIEVRAGSTTRAELLWREAAQSTGEVGGRVLEPDGAPSPSALVLAFTDGEEREIIGATWTDGEGRFQINLLPERASLERLQLQAANGGRRGQLAGVRTGLQGADVRLAPGATLSGRVVRTGAPVQGFTLTLEPEQFVPLAQKPGPWEFSGERFQVRDVPAGPALLRVRTQDGLQGERAVVLRPGATLEVDVSLP
ncbi:carboxypeptidase-like regulatory domain-containing protein [Archangium primigenium]|uniref:carboxypeptidase-like regulatory domain-containing protein n=1 Tax=[Archangium] primigenium TaxID=2792470 RepID=UPI00195E5856|nr:carboxypeptidase-like regulatory domain-containing protein [Archangium primigenium]MBM7118683.1 carboxypeptidase regulatory-like domain-containing protein [Archangium primigenium]